MHLPYNIMQTFFFSWGSLWHLLECTGTSIVFNWLGWNSEKTSSSSAFSESKPGRWRQRHLDHCSHGYPAGNMESFVTIFNFDQFLQSWLRPRCHQAPDTTGGRCNFNCHPWLLPSKRVEVAIALATIGDSPELLTPEARRRCHLTAACLLLWGECDETDHLASMELLPSKTLGRP